MGRNVKWLVTIQLQWLKENGSRLSMWRWHFLEPFSCTIHMQYKDTRGAKDHALRCFKIARACLKNHFRNLQASLCGIFYRRSVAVARYAALIRINDYK